MNLTVFQSGEGDCLLLTGKDGKRLLADGGMNPAYRDHVAAALSDLKKLDVVYVSHIDSDHISGVLQMMDDLVEWRVFDFKSKQGGAKPKQPKFPRPPKILNIWHNAFHDQVGDNAGEIENMLAANAVILSAEPGGASLSATEQKFRRGLVEVHQSLITSQKQAIELTHRVGPKQLNIPVNQPAKHQLMLVRGGKAKTPIKLGGMSIFVIAPFKEDLEKLRGEWNDWLKKNRDRVSDIQRRAKADEANLTSNEIEGIRGSMLGEAAEMLRFKLDEIKAGDLALAKDKKLIGVRNKVTTPNLASLMLLVEEGAGKKKRTILLTGDGHADDILKGLKHYGKLDADGRIHVNLLKVQHHGAEFNISPEFCAAVTADDYVFCGNGAHENPDLDVLDIIFDSRMTAGDKGKFKFWFNSNSSAASKAKDRAHMKKIEQRVPKLAGKSGGRMTFEFLEEDKFEIDIK
jgi:beta-lactamase superfamily II metal-dependent hydrolase